MRAPLREGPALHTDCAAAECGYNSHMATTVGIRDLKNSLSRWLRLVRGGEVVIVLDRGEPVAVLSAVTDRGSSRTVADHLGSLAARGLLSLGRPRGRSRPNRLPRGNLSDAVGEDRDDLA